MSGAVHESVVAQQRFARTGSEDSEDVRVLVNCGVIEKGKERRHRHQAI